jgi:hypothetical protein
VKLTLQFITGVAIAFLLLALVITCMRQHGEARRQPVNVSQYRLRSLESLCREYYKMTGELPDEDHWSLKLLEFNLGDHDLVSEDCDTRYLVDMFYDGWSHSFRYQIQRDLGDPVVMFYSIGPNGVDESGKGDDLAVTFTLQGVQ